MMFMTRFVFVYCNTVAQVWRGGSKVAAMASSKDDKQ